MRINDEPARAGERPCEAPDQSMADHSIIRLAARFPSHFRIVESEAVERCFESRLATGLNLAAIGARVEATAAGRSMTREVRSGTGFQSRGDQRLHFGLDQYRGSVSLDIRWPDGSRQVESTDELDRYVVVKEHS